MKGAACSMPTTSAVSSQVQYLWLPASASPTINDGTRGVRDSTQDQHAAFRIDVTTTQPNTEITIDHFCVSWYNVYVDGNYVAEGPTRFIGNAPFYATTTVTLQDVGKHVVAIHAHSANVQTRILLANSPVMYCQIRASPSSQIDVGAWKCRALSPDVYTAAAARLSVLLGWVERCSVSMGLQQAWKLVDFDDSKWDAPAHVDSPQLLLPVSLATLGVKPASSELGPLKMLEQGTFVERFGYAADDYAARFSLRRLTSNTCKSQASSTPFPADAPTRTRSFQRLLPVVVLFILAFAVVYLLLFPPSPHSSDAESLFSEAETPPSYTAAVKRAWRQHEIKLSFATMIALGVATVVFGGWQRQRISMKKSRHNTELDYGSAQGVYFRFDALRARLLRPVLVLRAPAGAVVEICYSQSLIDGRASPYHPLTGGSTCYLDQYTLDDSCSAGTPVTIFPLEPRGCRFIEVHIAIDDANDATSLAAIQLDSANALYRSYHAYHASPIGIFQCPSDSQLSAIWAVGSNSTQSCVEDTCIDGPCRERGQWTGDTLAVSLPNLSVLYDDLGPIKMCLLQSSQSRDHNGVMSGNCPEVTYPVDYALIWFEGAVGYWRASGDFDLMKQLLPLATACMDFFLSGACYKTSVGFSPTGYSAVIDWGYANNNAYPVDLCLNALLLSSLQALVSWVAAVDPASVEKYEQARDGQMQLLQTYLGMPQSVLCSQVLIRREGATTGIMSNRMARNATSLPFDPTKLGMHAAGLLLRAGVFDGPKNITARTACCAYIKAQLEAMFPITIDAPRLSDPSCRTKTGFYTPYFQTFTFAGLFRSGEADFVLDQYRQAWGWAMDQCDSTWLEVFDNRWEVVHSWGGCPTWQMSKFLLGLCPRADAGSRHYELKLHVGSKLPSAIGVVPTGDGNGTLEVAWSRGVPNTGSITYTLTVTGSDVFVLGWPSEVVDGDVFVTLPVGQHAAVFAATDCV